MTHEYVIATGGRIESLTAGGGKPTPTAVAWAADHVLAVGADDVVRSISRGDSTFLDLDGCVVTALPSDPVRADAVVAKAALSGGAEGGITALLVRAGLLSDDSALETGSPADLAFWDAASGSDASGERPARGLVAVVRGGGFTEGDEHHGPFPIARIA